MVDCKISKIVIFVNLTKKILKITKKARLNIIYKCVDTVYIMTNISKALIVLTITTTVASTTYPFTSI